MKFTWKNKLISCLTTTSLSILLITLVATLYQGHALCLSTVYEIFLANILIHAAFTLIEHLEIPYFLLEDFIQVASFLLILLLLGWIFNWYRSISMWTLILIGIGVYILACCMDIFRIHHSLTYINEQLKEPSKSSTPR